MCSVQSGLLPCAKRFGNVRESEYLCTLKQFISPFFRPIYWEKGPDFLFIFVVQVVQLFFFVFNLFSNNNNN